METTEPVDVLPTISLGFIAIDDIIDRLEIQQELTIIGMVTNVKEGDTVQIQVGAISQKVAVTNNQFTLTIPASEFLTHASLRADIIRNG